jgi:hypothetical protein
MNTDNFVHKILYSWDIVDPKEDFIKLVIKCSLEWFLVTVLRATYTTTKATHLNAPHWSHTPQGLQCNEDFMSEGKQLVVRTAGDKWPTWYSFEINFFAALKSWRDPPPPPVEYLVSNGRIRATITINSTGYKFDLSSVRIMKTHFIKFYFNIAKLWTSSSSQHSHFKGSNTKISFSFPCFYPATSMFLWINYVGIY